MTDRSVPTNTRAPKAGGDRLRITYKFDASTSTGQRKGNRSRNAMSLPRENILPMNGYDIIGDIHGCANKLEGLLQRLKYEEKNGVYRYSGPDGERQAIFVGDLIDRGSQQIRTLKLVRAMVEAGTAQMVMGNHEFNAISYATPNPEIGGEYMRPHTDKNDGQHKEFTDQIPSNSALYAQTIEWFKTLPLWLQFDGIRIVHACWSDGAIDEVKKWILPGMPMSTDFVIKANQKGSPEHKAIEVLLKGPEISLSAHEQPGFMDKDKIIRNDARIRWWNAEAETLRELAEIPKGVTTLDGTPYPELPDQKCVEETVYDYDGKEPVFYGHYWRSWAPDEGQDWTATTVCVDFSAVKGGPLVAYQWDRGAKVSPEHYVEYPETQLAETQ